MASTCRKITLLVILVIVFLLGIFLLTVFPLAIYPSLVKSQLKLSTSEDGQPTTITWYWSHLPAVAYYNFYLFNVTNIDEAWFNGERISVQDVGPYAWKEWETKNAVFSDDQETAFFENDKAWHYDPDASCDGCSPDDYVWIPNLALMATASLMHQAPNLTATQKLLTSYGTLLLGAYPFIQVKVREAVFDSYQDPLITMINSPLVKIIQKLTGKPLFGFSVPDIQDVGFFPKYNHTADMNYTVVTGKSDYKQVGAIATWAGSSSLGWWNNDEANDVTGSSDGSYWGGYLKKEDTLKNFQSFVCRYMNMEYSYDTDTDGISTRAYVFPDDIFDTTLEKNYGYIVDNSINETFFPKWANSHRLNPFNNLPFPPGLIEQKCFPGRNQRLPFMATLSQPHFYGADPEVIQNVFGLKPSKEKHSMGTFFVQPTVGSTVKAIMRIQFSVAMFRDKDVVALKYLTNSIVPSFWMEVNIQLKDYAKNYIRLNTKTIPLIVLILGIVFTVVPIIVVVSVFAFRYNKKRKRSWN